LESTDPEEQIKLEEEALGLIEKYGVEISDELINNEIKRRQMTIEERTKPGKKEAYQIQREGETVRDFGI